MSFLYKEQFKYLHWFHISVNILSFFGGIYLNDFAIIIISLLVILYSILRLVVFKKLKELGDTIAVQIALIFVIYFTENQPIAVVAMIINLTVGTFSTGIIDGNRISVIHILISIVLISPYVAIRMINGDSLIFAISIGTLLTMFSIMSYIKVQQKQRIFDAVKDKESELDAIRKSRASIAHDIKNILSAISVNIQMAQAKIEIENESSVSIKFLERAGSSVRHLDFIAQTLSFSNKSARLNSRDISVVQLFQKIFSLSEAFIDSRGIEVSVDFSKFNDVKVNSHALSSIFLNIINNSAKYSKGFININFNDTTILFENDVNYDIEGGSGIGMQDIKDACKFLGFRYSFYINEDIAITIIETNKEYLNENVDC